MKHAVISWVAMGTAFFVGGPVVSAVYGVGSSGTGGAGMNAMFAEPVMMGVAGLLGAVVVAGLIGVVCAKLCGVRAGYRCAGFALVWAAFDGGRIGDLLRHYEMPYTGLAIEALIAGAVLVGAGVVFDRMGRADGVEQEGKSERVAWALGLLIVVVVGLVVSGVVARTEVFGQCLAATIMAGIAGTLVARLKFPRVPLVACFGGCVVLAVMLPVIAAEVEGSGGVRDLFLGHYLAVARPMPLDWLAGSLIGVPMGASWAASMVDRQPVGVVVGAAGAEG